MFNFCNGCVAPMPWYLEIIPTILLFVLLTLVTICFWKLIEFIEKRR